MNIFLCPLFFCILHFLLHIKIEVSCLLFIKQSLNNFVELIFNHLIFQWNLLQPQFYLHLHFHLISKYYCFNLTLINIILFMGYFRNYSRCYSFEVCIFFNWNLTKGYLHVHFSFLDSSRFEAIFIY